MKIVPPEHITVKIDWDFFFPKHHQLYITHNPHLTSYQSVTEYLNDFGINEMSKEDLHKCIELNQLWGIRLYPDTSTSFYCVYGPSFERCLELIKKNVERIEKLKNDAMCKVY